MKVIDLKGGVHIVEDAPKMVQPEEMTEGQKLAEIKKRITDTITMERIKLENLEKPLTPKEISEPINTFENKQVDMEISESIVDLERKHLSPDVFTDDGKLLPKIRDFVLKAFDGIFKAAGVEEKDVVTVYIVGSILGKYYNDYTDIDCQAVIKGTEEVMDKVGDEIWKQFPVGYVFIDDNTHPVNLYVRGYTTDEEIYPHTVDGLYDIKKDEWIQRKQPKFIVDYSIYKMSSGWAGKVENDVGELRRDLIEYLFYSEGEKNKDKLAIEAEKIESFRSMKWTEMLYDLACIRDTMVSLKDWRTKNQVDMTDEYRALPDEIVVDYKNSHLFSGILIWKLLDRFGYITMMGQIKYLMLKFDKEELTKDQLINELSKALHLENLWKH